MPLDANEFDLLIARAINSAKATHLPTYAALRILLKSGEHYRPVLSSFTNRRSLNREAWRFLPFQILKEVSRENGIAYRDCFAGSPLTVLAESMILKLMSEEPSFTVPACAYSYLWPEFRLTGKNFSYYLDGYQKRNRRATELISDGSGNLAIIMDIKKFYPSIDREKLKEKVADRVSSFRDIDDQRRVTQFVNRYLNMNTFGERGIAIGPDLSHALGHVALDNVDKAAMNRFGDRYLRYVDDIIVIAKHSEATAVFSFMSDLLSREDLKPNETKTDYVSQAIWLRDNDLSAQASVAEPFNALFDGITLYLIDKPDNASSLQSMFRKEGFSIPMGRLQSRAKSSRFRAYLNSKVGVAAWFFRWLWLSEKYLLSKAKSVRAQYLSLAASLAHESAPSAPMQRRWYVQKRRLVLNRLLHLLTRNEYDRLLRLMPDMDEFFELRLVANVLRSGDASGVLAYPGRLVNSICQLWPEQMTGRPIKVTWPGDPSSAEAESAATIAMALSQFPPDEFLRNVGGKNPDARRLIEFCSCKQSSVPTTEKASYMDEVSELHREMEHGEVVELMSTRYNELEDVGLDGLHLGETVSASWSNANEIKA